MKLITFYFTYCGTRIQSILKDFNKDGLVLALAESKSVKIVTLNLMYAKTDCKQKYDTKYINFNCFDLLFDLPK